MVQLNINDERLGILRFHAKNIQIFHSLYIGEEHKTHVVQINYNKKDHLEKLKIKN
jgi:hypothetical protein